MLVQEQEVVGGSIRGETQALTEGSRDDETRVERAVPPYGDGKSTSSTRRRLRGKQRVPEELTTRDQGHELTRLRGKLKRSVRETVGAQPQEQQREGAAQHEQQRQLQPHVPIFIPDRDRRIKVVPPKPPSAKKR